MTLSNKLAFRFNFKITCVEFMYQDENGEQGPKASKYLQILALPSNFLYVVNTLKLV